MKKTALLMENGKRQVDAVGAVSTLNDCPFLRGKLITVRIEPPGTLVVTHGLGEPAAFIIVRHDYSRYGCGPVLAEASPLDIDENTQTRLVMYPTAVGWGNVGVFDLWFYPRASKPLADGETQA